MFGIRTKKHLTTKYSPYYLIFGREARYPSEVPREYEVTEEKVETLVRDKVVVSERLKQHEVYQEVRENIKKSHEKGQRLGPIRSLQQISRALPLERNW
ncbi:hypothetical protein GJAV_G00060160 [Gymnothorax javanicus]|nr:hypothetical protein GJAV_G00060160 [Gymnothorax javanicus]